ncbi:hypothetical protein [Arsenicicoccus piscis]|uniref:DUF2530 domain-containing protein n=1 Tax=Arsenicicoccus piscis TaxID=673954 RepID=A0ABQ6HKP4_9MICO|nr:hypothetical protein [Arsenicicoccus piscis]GMA18680.1 hypothetical protein GCM10025862_07010 [Arsenicicoccus piscis]
MVQQSLGTAPARRVPPVNWFAFSALTVTSVVAACAMVVCLVLLEVGWALGSFGALVVAVTGFWMLVEHRYEAPKVLGGSGLQRHLAR